MAENHIFLLDQSFEVERSRLSIKVENCNIEYRPVTVDTESQTFDAELLGRIHELIEAKEPVIETSDVSLLAVEPVVERCDVGLVASEPVIERLEKGSLAEEPKAEKCDVGLVPAFPDVTMSDKETLTDENMKSKREVFTEVTDDIHYNSSPEDNPLLYEVDDDGYDLHGGRLSSLSSSEFEANDQGFSTLSDDDPRTILTWNVSGLQNSMSKRAVWEPFVQMLKQHDPDIVILQDVKLCSSKILGTAPRLYMRVFGGYVSSSYDQEVHDADLVIKLQKTIFKKYYCIHSLSAWRVAGQLVFIKNEFKYLKIRFNLSIKTNAKYHHPEGRCIIVQFKSFYLLSLLSPLQGWVNRSVEMRSRWDRELARFLDNSKSNLPRSLLYHIFNSEDKATIISGNLNCAPEDIDLSDPEKLRMEKSVVLHKQDEVGFPGSRDIDRIGYYLITKAGNLTDVYRHKHPYDGSEERKKNIKYTTLGTFDKTRCFVRTNLVLMSKNFLNNVKRCEIIGRTEDMDPSGWRHLPQLLKLEKRETTLV
ncbi:endonuclease [Theileria orientalis strain Shintoku]|uniref:Endonuclease n=1 Tax=Theileria orientalis strain Shintoku TaxID=869250 RepID=J4D9U0_THEOR|nr:endonuclease [Theileria orientalis strain Shintoku]BAM41595.1 endonuclease [Theileria orientalis strain Shintoku]|eukprot:XP_009691896.1 endonuclease [Theileria orientalis strain Shintoku]